MKKLKKILVWFLMIVVIFIAGGMSYVKLALPNVGAASEMKIESTPENIARGEYLANHVTVCIDCHSKRDWTKFSGPPIEGTFGMGGEIFDQKYGFPGAYYAANITPEGISRYTDGELFRVILSSTQFRKKHTSQRDLIKKILLLTENILQPQQDVLNVILRRIKEN